MLKDEIEHDDRVTAPAIQGLVGLDKHDRSTLHQASQLGILRETQRYLAERIVRLRLVSV